MHKGYKFLDKSTGQVYIPQDMIFDESHFPFATPSHSPISPSMSGVTSFPQTEPVIVNDHMRNYD